MLKNFSQPFEAGLSTAYMLIEDRASGKFVAFNSAEDTEEFGEDQSYRPLLLRLSPDKNYITQLAEQLYHNGFVLNTLREMAKETIVQFSFKDETPGSTSDALCLYATVDIITNYRHGDDIKFLTLADLSRKLREGILAHPVLDAGLALLAVEQESKIQA